MQNNKITEEVYAMKRMKNTIYERKGINMLTMWTTRRIKEGVYESEDHGSGVYESEVYESGYNRNDGHVENVYNKNDGHVPIHIPINIPNNNNSFKFLIGSINKQNINFNAHKYKPSTFITTQRIIGNTVEINDFDGIRTDTNRKESSFINPLVYNHFTESGFKTHQEHQNQIQNIFINQNTKNYVKNELRNFYNSEILSRDFKRPRKRCPNFKNHKIESKRKRSNSLIWGEYENEGGCIREYEYEKCIMEYEGGCIRYCDYKYMNDNPLLLNTTTLRDDILYSIYKSYNMKNNVFYSNFLSKLAFFNFTNIILGLRIFKNYLEISNSKYENLDFLYSVCCVIASKYLDDVHVYNNRITESSSIVNKLEMKILITLNYSIEFDLINYYNTINEVFK